MTKKEKLLEEIIKIIDRTENLLDDPELERGANRQRTRSILPKDKGFVPNI